MKTLIENLEEELYALITEVAFLGALPKEKGHHQGFSAKACCKISAKKIIDLFVNELESNPNEDGSTSPNIQHWIEKKQSQLRSSCLNS